MRTKNASNIKGTFTVLCDVPIEILVTVLCDVTFLCDNINRCKGHSQVSKLLTRSKSSEIGFRERNQNSIRKVESLVRTP